MNSTSQRFSIVVFARMLKDAFRDLLKNDPLRMAGATAFFTVFALPPILIILIQVLGLAFNQRHISKRLFQALATIIERESVQQLVHTLVAFRKMTSNWFLTIAGFIFLLFIATTLFKVIKGSVNQLWRIRVIKKSSIWTSLRPRVQSILVIVMAGVLFIPILLTAGTKPFLTSKLYRASPDTVFYFNGTLNFIISVVFITLWFAIVFRFLPDGRPAWKVALTGALFTSILFNTGKLVLRWMLEHSNIHDVYGASGSLVLILLFVFYSSLILYFGAAFTKIWGAYHNAPIRPLPHARHYTVKDADDEDGD